MKNIESNKKQMMPHSSYYVESYPAFTTYCCNAYSVRKIEKFLIDPYDILPTKMVLQSPGGINSITEFDDNEMELINPMEEHKIDHVGLSYILSGIIDEGLLDMIIDDLLAWGITEICNTITNPTLETTTENFCHRAYFSTKAEDFLDYMIRILIHPEDEPIAANNAIRKVLKSLSQMPDAILRELYLKKLVKVCGIPEEVLRAKIKNEG